MELLPVKQFLEENTDFINHPDCRESLYLSIEFYKKVGFNMPWIGYYVRLKGELVGMAAFKGKPVDGKVEIAYGTISRYQHNGIATQICRQLVELSLSTDRSVRIFARTLPVENFSTKVLRKNNFYCVGTVMDPEDGEVWEWEYKSH